MVIRTLMASLATGGLPRFDFLALFILDGFMILWCHKFMGRASGDDVARLQLQLTQKEPSMAKPARVSSTPPKSTPANSDAFRLTELSTEGCPVVPLMRMAIAARNAHSRLEAKPGANKDQVRELWDVHNVFLSMATVTRAKSLQGALFQLALLMETVHVDLLQNLPGGIQNEVLVHEQKAMRLLQSAASVIEQIIGDAAAREARDIWLVDSNLNDVDRIAAGLPIESRPVWR